ncbi:helix-turn-helix domain-containing protein [Acinetobacter pittii]|uniref:helix-turn-helix domain-containing protein n=1 Tax=Acinetobacter pittii TaxID=48296 RepID=UPI000F73F810|nr:helix-turn-helix domain-containing protein [Acinetobacter pittii]MDX8157806.1 hypothetical protein [Acinetobacter pittii]RSO48434.1 hypothetical protein EA757_07045 [Acinetobacter pittii]RSO77824.1 hypothetical protein EA753_07955 [Acinetobacter pittii]HIN56148.1 hypothetical protein [Acinetobacter pittii]
MKGYVEIFDTMLSSLSHFTESDKPLSVKEIGYRLGLQTRTAQRIAKALQESGWLTSQKTGVGNFFTATDKARALFKTNENLVKAFHNYKVNDCVVLKEKEVYFPDGTNKTNELFVVVRVGNEGLEIDLMEVGGTHKIFKTWIGDIQHATYEEIAAGCRENKNSEEFKVGDFVLPISNEFSDKVCELIEDYGYEFKYKNKDGGFGYITKSFLPIKWRRATEAEVIIGYRCVEVKECF